MTATTTVTLTPKQAGHVASCILADLPGLISGSMVSPPTRNCINEVRATLDHRDKWLDQLERVGDDGMVTWTAPKPEIVGAAVDLLAKGMDNALTADILEDGSNALEHLASREWLSMAETAIAIRDQLARNGSVS